MKERKHASWTTKNEIDFIKKIGTGSFSTISRKVKSTSRRKLLKGYINGCKLRDNWEGIDKDQIIAYAMNSLTYSSDYVF